MGIGHVVGELGQQPVRLKQVLRHARVPCFLAGETDKVHGAVAVDEVTGEAELTFAAAHEGHSGHAIADLDTAGLRHCHDLARGFVAHEKGVLPGHKRFVLVHMGAA